MMRPIRETGRRHPTALSMALLFGMASQASMAAVAGDERLVLQLRSRVEDPGAAGGYRAVVKSATWDPKATAIIVCDMWDLHHSLNATLRLRDMAPRRMRISGVARARG